ncbi:alpha/beta hydrolase family protein [Hoeflea ulvae]|uniref:Alpha/beta fold hydrolase n=1 Tax=Hoeflea ulvae TaxID=2983764 RepID=A0ABT3YF65_9HYPH|nr:alpha/beta fold hydrolase [Hoeflea ulvae]MCY0094513.1 alpha/beta fold hydrolase [Hoeflea ulvae]
MKRFLQMATIVVATMASSAQAQNYQTGLADLTIADTAGQRDLEGFVWYPTTETEELSEQHSNQVWAGIKAIKDARPAAGQHPLVVLSHGMYGNAMNQSWLASALAQRGYVVAAINHPGTSTWARDAEDARQMWQRPKDVSRVIDHLLATSDLSEHIQPDRIFMAGHSLGGFTAMALAGGRYDAKAFGDFCDGRPGELVCGIFANWNVAQTPDDIATMSADLSDPRIKAFAVFDLGGTQTFSSESLGRIKTPMLIFGAPRDIEATGIDLDVESRALVAALPKPSVTYLEPANLAHFDFLGECRPNGLEILKQEEPDDAFICIDGATERRALHAMIIDEVAVHFARQ